MKHDSVSQAWCLPVGRFWNPNASPHTPTYMERLLGTGGRRYVVAAAALTVLLSGPLLWLIVALEARSLTEGFARVTEALHADVTSWRFALGLVLNGVTTFLVFYMPRVVRLKTVEAELQIAPLLPEGAAGYRRIFGVINQPVPALLVGLVPSVAVTWATVVEQTATGSPGLVASSILNSALFYPAQSLAIWIYFASSWALYQIGRPPLRLKPYYEDSMMGARPIGSLALVNASMLFGIMGLVAIAILISPPDSMPLAYLLFVATITLGGVVGFLLPLHSIHRRMHEEKVRHLGELTKHSLAFLGHANDPAHPETDATLGDLRDLLADVRHALAHQHLERRIQVVPTWPFDTRVVGRLAAVVVSIIVSIAIKIVNDYLRI